MLKYTVQSFIKRIRHNDPPTLLSLSHTHWKTHSIYKKTPFGKKNIAKYFYDPPETQESNTMHTFTKEKYFFPFLLIAKNTLRN